MECRRQIDVEARKLHLLQIAVERAFDGDWVVGIAADETCRHIAYESHQVLLAQLRIQAHLHLTRILLFKGVEV